jgi:hypothetical protein
MSRIEAGLAFDPSALSLTPKLGVGFLGLDAAFSLVADLILGNAGVAARLTVDAVRLLGFGRAAAQTGAHKGLAGVAGHAFRLRVALCHFLLLRIELGAGGYREAHQHCKHGKSPFHRRSSPKIPSSMRHDITNF